MANSPVIIVSSCIWVTGNTGNGIQWKLFQGFRKSSISSLHVSERARYVAKQHHADYASFTDLGITDSSIETTTDHHELGTELDNANTQQAKSRNSQRHCN